jgi:uncharacterized protein (DUF1330 family)
MKRYVTLGFSIVAGAALGAAAVEVIHAQTKPMGYVIALNVVNNPDSYAKECASVVDKTIVDAGGKFLVRGGRTIPMHGTPPASRVVVVQFASLDQAEAWAKSPAATVGFAACAEYGTLNDFAVEGVSPLGFRARGLGIG